MILAVDTLGIGFAAWLLVGLGLAILFGKVIAHGAERDPGPSAPTPSLEDADAPPESGVALSEFEVWQRQREARVARAMARHTDRSGRVS